MDSSDDVNVTFTGWETDQFVLFGKLLGDIGGDWRVRIIGREPITAVTVDFAGSLGGYDWNGYRRVVIVTADDGRTFEIGGTNATRPIAAESVIFERIPLRHLGQVAGAGELTAMFEDARGVSADDLFGSLVAATNGVRLGHLPPSGQHALAADVAGLLAVGWPTEIRTAIARLLGMLESPNSLPGLLQLLAAPEPAVRREVVLRLRGLEPLIKSLGQDHGLGADVIEMLSRTVAEDPEFDVRTYAAEDLGYFYNDAAVARLERALREDDHPHVRWASAVALGRTNSTTAIDRLLDALTVEVDPQVTQGCVLGIGRLASQVSQAGDGMAQRLNELLLPLLNDPASPVRDLAAFAVGELPVKETDRSQALIRCLDSGQYRVRSSAAAALLKQSSRGLVSPELWPAVTETISGAEESTDLSALVWPDSAYYAWYLVNAAELAALMEAHDLSSRMYALAARVFVGARWLSRYYEGISAYENAEHLTPISLSDAAAELDKALAQFQEVSEDPEFRALSDEAQSGLRFKLAMAKGRREVVAALQCWWSNTLPSKPEAMEAAARFTRAVDEYRNIDVFNLSEGEKELTREEQAVTLGLLALADIGRLACELRLALLDWQPERVTLGIGIVRQEMRSFVEVIRLGRSRALVEVGEELVRIADHSAEEESTGQNRADVAATMLRGIRSVFALSLPTPGTCPVVDFGRSTFAVTLDGALSGDGSQQNPYLFPAQTRLIFGVVVTVIRRTKNDRLVFLCEDGVTTARNAEQEVPVHESSYSLRPIDFGPQDPTLTPLQFRFRLEFRNSGCQQVVDNQTVHVRIAVPFAARYDDEWRDRDEASIRLDQQRLDELHQLSRERFSAENPMPMEMRQQIRTLEAAVARKRSRLVPKPYGG